MDWGNLAKLVGGVGGAAFTGGATLPLALQGASGLMSGAAKGAATERGNENNYGVLQDRTKAALYGTEQGALLNALMARSNEQSNRYGTKQGATTNAMQGLQGATTSALANQSAEGMARAQLGLQAPSIRAKQSVLGSMMKNMQPTSYQGPAGQRGHETKLSGGLNASTLDPQTRAQGEALLQQALQAQLSGSDIPEKTDFKSGIQDWKSTILDVPEATDYSKGIIKPPAVSEYEKAGKAESILGMLGMGLGVAGQVAGGLGGNDGGGAVMNNQMPSPYSGSNASGTYSGFQLPRVNLQDEFADALGV